MRSDPNERMTIGVPRIRRADAADAHAIAEIVVHGWQTAYRGILPDDFLAGLSVSAREVAWRMRLESGADAADPIWVAERAGAVIGFVSCGPPRDEELQSTARDGYRLGAEIYAIYVDSNSWRSGTGRALLKTAIAYLHSRGAEILVLWVLEKNANGRAFYEAMSWRPDGARQSVDFGDFTVPEVRYRLSL